MYDIQISGVFAALLTPRTAEGEIDVPALRNLVHFLMNSGISFFAVNGATGEFCVTSPARCASSSLHHPLYSQGGPGLQ
jgi:dihydrodipicolinate synthase/N-acetylneuraminate lyase